MNGRNYERMGTKFPLKYGPEVLAQNHILPSANGNIQQGLPNADLKYLTWENDSQFLLSPRLFIKKITLKWEA